MKNEPFVSVIMPVRQEAAFIGRSLGTVLHQDYPAEKVELLIVDGMSLDGTREAIADYQKTKSNIRLIDNPQKIVSTGLNQAIREAKGEIIVRVDGHSEIAPDYVRQCVAALQESGADAVGGPIDTIGETFMAKAIAIGMSSWFGVGGSAFRTLKDREIEIDTVPFPAYKRELFDKIGLFDEELVRNQDDEHNYRIRESGGKVLLTPKIRSKYYSRSSLFSLGKQYFQYGYWKVRVFQKHPRQMQWRQFVPPVFVLSLITALAFALLGKSSLLIFVGGAYVLANLGASLHTASKSSFRYLFLLPLVYTVLHLSYGLGFLVGLVKFAGRGR